MIKSAAPFRLLTTVVLCAGLGEISLAQSPRQVVPHEEHRKAPPSDLRTPKGRPPSTYQNPLPGTTGRPGETPRRVDPNSPYFEVRQGRLFNLGTKPARRVRLSYPDNRLLADRLSQGESVPAPDGSFQLEWDWESPAAGWIHEGPVSFYFESVALSDTPSMSLVPASTYTFIPTVILRSRTPTTFKFLHEIPTSPGAANRPTEFVTSEQNVKQGVFASFSFRPAASIWPASGMLYVEYQTRPDEPAQRIELPVRRSQIAPQYLTMPQEMRPRPIAVPVRPDHTAKYWGMAVVLGVILYLAFLAAMRGKEEPDAVAFKGGGFLSASFKRLLGFSSTRESEGGAEEGSSEPSQAHLGMQETKAPPRTFSNQKNIFTKWTHRIVSQKDTLDPEGKVFCVDDDSGNLWYAWPRPGPKGGIQCFMTRNKAMGQPLPQSPDTGSPSAKANPSGRFIFRPGKKKTQPYLASYTLKAEKGHFSVSDPGGGAPWYLHVGEHGLKWARDKEGSLYQIPDDFEYEIVDGQLHPPRKKKDPSEVSETGGPGAAEKT